MTKQRIIILVLFVSLVANAFFVGFAATRVFDTPDEKQRTGILRAVAARITKNIDEESRAGVAATLDELTPQYRENQQARRDNYEKLRLLLAEQQPDQEAIDQLLQQMQTQSSQFVVLVHDKAVAEILKLPAEKRAELPTPE